MTPTHLHLLLNHIPILGTFFGICLLVYGLIRKNKSLEMAALVTLIIVTLFTIPAFLTGEEAEETVEHLQGVSEFYLEEHEELAEVSLWFMISTGVLSLVSVVLTQMNKTKQGLFKTLALILAIVTFGVMVLVGEHGGKIRHSELIDKSDMKQHHDEEHHDD